MRTKAIQTLNQIVDVIEGNLFKDIEEIFYYKDKLIRIKLDSMLMDEEKDFLLHDFLDLNLEVAIVNDIHTQCANLYVEV